jgi:hypothetical protein
MQEQTTALHLAVNRKSSNVVNVLLQAKANVHRRDELGLTPLHYACYSGFRGITTALVDAGADLKAQDKVGCGRAQIALHAASDCCCGSPLSRSNALARHHM